MSDQSHSFTIRPSVLGASDGKYVVTYHADGHIYAKILNSGQYFNLSSRSEATSGINQLDTALQTLNSQRASLGALSNRIDHIVANNTNTATNIARSISRIEDADFASETTNLAKQQILQQAATAMLAQANASKQNILTLLQM